MNAMHHYDIKVTLTTRTGSTREYDGLVAFIDDWRFFFSSGKENSDEEVFDKMVNALTALNEHKASLEIVRNGLAVKFNYDRFGLKK